MQALAVTTTSFNPSTIQVLYTSTLLLTYLALVYCPGFWLSLRMNIDSLLTVGSHYRNEKLVH